MDHYVGYLRVSTKKQGEGVSLNEQKEAISDYAQKHGFDISRWFEEQVTAAKKGRKAFNEMISYLKQGKVKGVVIHKIDRSARNLSDWSKFSSLIDIGVDIRFVSGDLVLADRSARLSADLQAVIAADYIRNLREEIHKGVYGRLKKGFYPWAAPLGYVNNGKGKLKTIHPTKGSLVKKAFQLYATGEYSIAQLSEELFVLGLRNSNGRNLVKDHLWKILKNPFYTGIIKIGTTGEIFEGKHQPLIDISLFEQVQTVMRGKSVRKVVRHDYLFKRLFKCGYCHYSLIGEKQKGHIYYRCQTNTCPTKTIRQEALESHLQSHISHFQFSENEIKGIKKLLSLGLKDATKDQAELIESITRQMELTNSRQQRLDNALLDGVFTTEQYKEKEVPLIKEITLLKQKLNQLKAKQSLFITTVNKNLELLISFYSSYIHGSISQKRQLIKKLTSNRILKERNASFKLKTPFRELLGMGDVSYCADLRVRPRTKAQQKKKAETIAEILIECSKDQIKSNEDM